MLNIGRYSVIIFVSNYVVVLENKGYCQLIKNFMFGKARYRSSRFIYYSLGLRPNSNPMLSIAQNILLNFKEIVKLVLRFCEYSILSVPQS